MSFMSPGVDNTAAAEEAARQAKIKQGQSSIDKAFLGFDDPYFQGRARDYTAWGLPQVEDQFTKAAEQLKYGLARQYGTTQSSEAARRQAELTKQYQLAKAGVAQTGQDLAAQAKTDVEKERGVLTSQLQSTADPYAAANAAAQQAKLLQNQSAFTPLGNLFSDVTAGLAGATSPYGLLSSQYGPTYKLPGSGSKASTIVQTG